MIQIQIKLKTCTVLISFHYSLLHVLYVICACLLNKIPFPILYVFGEKILSEGNRVSALQWLEFSSACISDTTEI